MATVSTANLADFTNGEYDGENECNKLQSFFSVDKISKHGNDFNDSSQTSNPLKSAQKPSKEVSGEELELLAKLEEQNRCVAFGFPFFLIFDSTG